MTMREGITSARVMPTTATKVLTLIRLTRQRRQAKRTFLGALARADMSEKCSAVGYGRYCYWPQPHMATAYLSR
jgi:hypothetical protein